MKPKPCPFCGETRGSYLGNERGAVFHDRWRCEGCFSLGPEAVSRDKIECQKTALAYWNDRYIEDNGKLPWRV